MTDTIHAPQIDHVELFVPDQYEAAKSYKTVFGLEILPQYEFWAPDGGPLMISADGGHTKLALFLGTPRGTRETAGHHRVAFRVDGPTFVDFVKRAKTMPLFDNQIQPRDALEVFDHQKSFSVYFCDPWGNRYELTTYDYDSVSKQS
jgi:catechol 2,3-dioxygenase-like lactoylglutathione lyase family enzyme